MSQEVDEEPMAIEAVLRTNCRFIPGVSENHAIIFQELVAEFIKFGGGDTKEITLSDGLRCSTMAR
jgi:hypothetical protein